MNVDNNNIVDWNRICEKIHDVQENRDDQICDLENIISVLENNYISPNEIFILLYYGNINRNTLVSNMFKYKLRTTFLGVYVLSAYEFWKGNEYTLSKHIPGKTYVIMFDDFDGKYKGNVYMCGSFDNFIVMKRIFQHGNLIVTVNKPYYKRNDKSHKIPKYSKNEHDNPVVHPKKNKKHGLYISKENYVRLYNGPVEKYIDFDYMLFHNNIENSMEFMSSVSNDLVHGQTN